LDLLAGRWRLKGKNLQAASEAGTAVTGEILYEWLPGNFFMSCKWDRHFENGKYQGIGIIGFDEQAKKLYTNYYDNLGFARRYEISYANRVFKFRSDKARAVIRFSSDGYSYTEDWEALNEDGWQPLCHLAAVKISSSRNTETCHPYVRLTLSRKE